jgi:N-acetylglutamate synthase-like GNAT family acetyltransferase
VEPAQQGRGVGQALVEYVCDLWRNPQERQKLKGFQDHPIEEPIWLVTPNPGYYLNIDFELIEPDQAPRSLRQKTKGALSQNTPMKTQTYRSRSTKTI